MSQSKLLNKIKWENRMNKFIADLRLEIHTKVILPVVTTASKLIGDINEVEAKSSQLTNQSKIEF